MNCPKCGLMNTGNMAVGLAMPQCMCQWQSTQEKSRIETVPAQGTLLPQREWQGLTDEEEIEDEWERITGHSIYGGERREGRTMYLSPDEVIEFARAIDQALREKNT